MIDENLNAVWSIDDEESILCFMQNSKVKRLKILLFLNETIF